MTTPFQDLISDEAIEFRKKRTLNLNEVVSSEFVKEYKRITASWEALGIALETLELIKNDGLQMSYDHQEIAKDTLREIQKLDERSR